MIHILNILTPITTDFIKQYTITDAENIAAIDSSPANNPKFEYFMTTYAYNKYKEENKIYYMHSYDMPYFITHHNEIASEKCVYPVIFVYDKTDNTYHLCRSVSEKEPTHLIDITYRLNHNLDFWSKYYCPIIISTNPVTVNSLIDKQQTDIDSIVYFYDTKDEAINAAYKYFVNKLSIIVSNLNTEIIIYNTDYTYKRLFNEIYHQRVKNIKEEITQELEHNKQNLLQEIGKKQNYLKNIIESANEKSITI